MCGESPEESRPAGLHAAPRKRGAGTRQGGGLIWGLRLCEVGAQGTHVMGVEHRLERKLAAPWGWEAPGKASSAVRAGARDPALPGLLSSSLPSHNDPGKVHALVPLYRGRNGGRAAVASSPPLLCSWWPQVRAGESLMKLVSDLKQFLILNDFPSVNEAIDQRNQQLRALQEECDRKLIALRDEISIDLYELEEEYYSSRNNLYLTLTKKKGLQPMEHVWGKGRRSGPNLTGVSTVFSVMTPEQQALCTISVLFSWAEATVPIGNGKRSGFPPPRPEQGSSPPPPPL
ncbi:mediator of RNA polymerase II transcription subunit 22 isoform X1 [Panthera tigris]|uniref:mediator of RNA polymerase II transcription subunit 22 isoform X1 n=1 Tax=Panthera tigris TaxID=9694 RepID=UPI001C6FC4B8|nr:mediator of RNA polymerase II transcription subunit 22 isoform X1 [Panthera tigris]